MQENFHQFKLILCTDGIFPYAIGGMAVHARFLIEELAQTNKFDIIVIHPHQTHIFDKKLNIKEVNIQGINPYRNYILECYRYSKRVYSVLEKYPDYIIYSQGFSVWYRVKTISNRLLVNPHGLNYYQTTTVWDFLRGLPFRIIFDYLSNYAIKVVSQGGKLTSILKNNIKDISKIVVLPNGVNMPDDYNTSERFRSDSRNLKVLFIARFVHGKGINILLRAIKELNDEGYADKITYYLGGVGRLYEYYSSNFKYKNVSYLEFVRNGQLYKSSDLFVLPSFSEGMPMVVLEAMSYGLPIIVSNVGAMPELVDANNGYLIERNNVNELKKSIINFYHLGAEEKKRLSENSYDRVKKHFTWRDVVNKYIEVFRELANSSTLPYES